jgi:uncharacterized protein
VPNNEKESPVWKFEIYADIGGNYRWRLKASNGQIVASSGESFSSHANAERAAENVRDNAGGASIESA